LFCDIGGILGLYIGFSILTIFEFFDFLFEFLWVIFSKPRPPKNSVAGRGKTLQNQPDATFPGGPLELGKHPNGHPSPPNYYDQFLKGGGHKPSDSIGKKQMTEVIC
jgi:hypothetical protein